LCSKRRRSRDEVGLAAVDMTTALRAHKAPGDPREHGVEADSRNNSSRP